VVKALENYNLDAGLASIWLQIKDADVFINKRGVWNLAGKQKEAALANLVTRVRQIAYDLSPYLPETSAKILKQFLGPKIKTSTPLFPRLK